MSLSSSVRTFMRAFQFRVLIDGFRSSSFSSVSELHTDADRISPQIGSVSRGKTNDDDQDMLSWARVKDMRNVNVVGLDRDGEEIGRIALRARPTQYTTGERDCSKSEVLIETVTFEYDAGEAKTVYFDR